VQIGHDEVSTASIEDALFLFEHSFVFASRRNIQNETTGQVAAGEVARAASVIG
jgi:hypothetical protein